VWRQVSLSDLRAVFAVLRVSAAVLLNNGAGCKVSALDSIGDGLSTDELGQEATSESVSGAVGVDELFLAERNDGELEHFVVFDDNRWFIALGDDNHAFAILVHLGQSGNLFGDLLDASGLELVDLCEGDGFAFVSKKNVDVGKRLHEWLSEELRDEGSGQIHHEDFVVLSGVLGHAHDGWRAYSEEESSNVVELGLLN